jgi:hypothetical protein
LHYYKKLHYTWQYFLIYTMKQNFGMPYIWSWFFPVTVLYMTKNNWNLSFIHYLFILPFMGHLYIAWQFSPYGSDGEESGSYIRQWRGRTRIIYKIWLCIIWITIICCKQRTSCLSCLSVSLGIFIKKGAWYFLGESKKMQILQLQIKIER